MFSLLTYIALIVGINCAFACTPLITLPTGDLWSPVSLVVGFVFVVRDFAQRRLGHHVLWGMLAGCIISWLLASPELALASALHKLETGVAAAPMPQDPRLEPVSAMMLAMAPVVLLGAPT